jgi:cell division control protein 6
VVYNISNTHIFDYVGKKGIIIRADVLSPDDYLPSVLIGRDIQIQELAYLMKPLFLRGAPNNALIFGSPGCGKTATSKYVLRALMDKLEHDPIDINVDWICISCKEVYTTNAVLFKLIEYLDPKNKVKRSGSSMDYYYEILYFLINEKNTALVVILDEIDFLKSDDILYSFSRAISNGKFTGRQFIRIIGLSNSLKFEEKLDQRVLSSIGFEKFRFLSYNMMIFIIF